MGQKNMGVMVTVACVYWKGKFRGREVYDSSWVAKLRNMVARNLPMEHRFVCLSNADVPCVKIDLIHDWPGFWSKIELFRPGLFEGRVLYLDLDIVITGDLTPFVEFPSKFAIIKTWAPPKLMVYEGKKIAGEYNSSVMVWDAGAGDSVYTQFDPDIMEEIYSDQDHIGYLRPDLDVFPYPWVKKLKHLSNGGPPGENTKVVLCMFHHPLKNIAAAKKYKWIEELWK